MRSIIIIFTLLALLAGLYVYSTQKIEFVNIPTYQSGRTAIKEELQNAEEKNAKCPNVLVRNGNILLLYNTMDVHDEIPIQFNSLDEYTEYLKNQRNKGIYCPVLYVQNENDVQGNDVYRIRPSPFDQAGGIIPITVAQNNQQTQISYPPALPLVDSNVDNPPFNANNYPGFDPYGLQIGEFTVLDAVHYSTAANNLSDNPMDPNWGGVQYSQSVVDSGKYIDNNVQPPNFSRSGGTQFFPGIHNDIIQDPPNFRNTRQ
jgi:hypothetical protein